MSKKHFFIEHKNNNGSLFLWAVKYNHDVSLITPELFFYQLSRLSRFEENDFQFVTTITHPIHGEYTKIIISESVACQFYADLPNKRRSIYFKDMLIKFLLIDVFNPKEDYPYKIKHYSNPLIYLLEHYKSAQIKQEFGNLEWGLDGTVN